MDARRFRVLFAWCLALADTATLSAAFYLAYRLRVVVHWPNEAVEIPSRFLPYTSVLIIFVVSILAVFLTLRMYHLVRATSRVDEFYAISSGVLGGTLLAVAVASLTLKNSVFEVNLPRVMIFYAWGLGTLLVTLERWLLQRLRALWHIRGFARDRVIVIGTGEVAELVTQKILSSPYLGYQMVGLVTDEATLPAWAANFALVGRTIDLPRLLEDLNIDEVIIANPDASDAELGRLIALCQRDRVSIKIFPDVFEIMAAGVTIDDLGGLPLLNVRDVAQRGWRLFFKRGLDLTGSALGLIFLSPLLMLIAFLIRLESKGPVFFVQERMGLDAKPFPMFKFRSMRADAEAHGPGWTVKDDPRRTRIGTFIRKYSIDELPQLINILLGDMSIVGPRPEQPAFVEDFRKMIPRYMERHREKSGLTGWAQVNGLRGDTSITERVKYDLWYIENWSIWLDIKIIIRTVVRILFDRNAY